MNESFIRKKLKTVGQFFFFAFFAALPFQVKTLIFTEDFYAGGFFNPYLSHFLYLSDIFLFFCFLFLGLLLIFGGGKGSKKIVDLDLGLLVVLGIFLATYIFSIVTSVDKINSLIYGFRFFEFFMVFFLIAGKFFDTKKALYVFLGSLSLVSVLALLQYILQHSVGLGFLGEPIFSANTLGVAKVAFFDKEVVRVYGTFPHPNIFGGYLVFGFLLALYFWKENKRLFTALMILFGITIVLTFSRSAMLALIAGLVVYYSFIKIKISWSYLLFGVMFFVFLIFALDLFPILSQRFILGDANSIVERQLFYDASKNMAFNQWNGVGAGNFTGEMQNYVDEKLMPWQFQPVHNIFMLVLNEIGIFGLMIFVYLFGYLLNSFLKKIKLNGSNKNFLAFLIAIEMAFFVVGMVDHYPISLYQGQMLFWIFLALANGSLVEENSSF